MRLALIIILFLYVLYKLGLFRVFVSSAQRGYFENEPKRSGNIHVDNAPPREKRNSDFKGGEYIDYEEVK